MLAFQELVTVSTEIESEKFSQNSYLRKISPILFDENLITDIPKKQICSTYIFPSSSTIQNSSTIPPVEFKTVE